MVMDLLREGLGVGEKLGCKLFIDGGSAASEVVRECESFVVREGHWDVKLEVRAINLTLWSMSTYGNQPSWDHCNWVSQSS